MSPDGMTRLISASLLILSTTALSGCIVGTAVSVAGDVAEGAVNVTGAAVGAVIPDGDRDEREKD